jgi:hypothetical protein
MPGRIRLRPRFRNYIGAWLDFLLVSPREMVGILRGTGWKESHLIEDSSLTYVAVLQ